MAAPNVGKVLRGLASWWPYLLLVALLTAGFVVYRRDPAKPRIDAGAAAESRSQHPLVDADMPALAKVLGQAWAGEPPDRGRLAPRLGEPAQSVYVAFRAGGRKVLDLWVHPDQLPQPGTVGDALLEAVRLGRERLAARRGDVTRLEIDLTHSYRTVRHSKKEDEILDHDPQKVARHRGIRGMRVAQGERVELWAPTAQIASNQSNKELLDELRGRWSLSENAFAESTYQSFEADQVLVRLDKSPVEAVSMFRGNRVVDIAEVDRASTERLATGMRDWLVASVRASGRLVYMMEPSTGEEGKGNNQIRQWMATNAMIRWGLERGDAALLDLAEKNIDYDQKFYSQEGPLGLINEGTKVKLGAVALAGLAMYTHPKRAKWATQVAGLRAMVDHLWNKDGSFRSYHAGGDGEQWNFYPGEALLFWAFIYAQEKDPEILRKIKLSEAFYKEWHLDPKHRNPAFVPWHLQAYYETWKVLGDDEQAFKKELETFSFEMADWLVELQQWDPTDGHNYPDERGRFYTPDRNFGVPHASSTGVYIEGLIDAWQLARDVKDAPRREKYRVSLIRALRSMMQLQFVDDVDLFYVADEVGIVGGLRTNESNNQIRCDNVQHPLMGIVKLLRMFEPDEYKNAQ